MSTVSQRELRNDNARVVREVELGATVTVTRRGVPVARLVPIRPDADLPCIRPATSRPEYGRWPRVVAGSTAEVLADLRDER